MINDSALNRFNDLIKPKDFQVKLYYKIYKFKFVLLGNIESCQRSGGR